MAPGLSTFCLKLVDSQTKGEILAENDESEGGRRAPMYVLESEDGMRTRPLTFGRQYSCLSEDLTDRDGNVVGRANWDYAAVPAGAYWVRIVNLPDGYGAREGIRVELSEIDSSPIAVELDRRVEAEPSGGWGLAAAIREGLSRISKFDAQWLAAMVGLVFAWACLAAPFAWVVAFSAIAAKTPGFGIFFAFGNISDYLSSYILNGWRAVGLLSSAYGSPLLAWAIAAALAAAGFAWSAAAATAKIDSRRLSNPLIDKAPPVAGDNQFGSSVVLRKPDELKAELDSIDPDDPDLELSGVVLGTMPEPLPKEAIESVRCAVGTWAAGFMPGRRAVPAVRGRYATCVEDENSIIFGGTRAGKTRRILLATIHSLLAASGESMIILDPKGELFGLTSRKAMEVLGAENVIRIDLRSPAFSNSVNPLQLVIDAAGRGRDGGKPDFDLMVQTAGDVVEALMPSANDTAGSKFWNDGARSYVKTAILYVVSSQSIPEDQLTITTVCRILERYGQDRDERPAKGGAKPPRYNPFECMVDEFPMNHPVTEAYATLRNAIDKERSQFITTALTNLRDWRDSNIAAMTSTTSLPWKEVGKRRCAVYIIIPAEKDTYAAFARLFISQAYTALIGESSLYGGRLPYRVNMLCEEFGQIPAIDKLPNWLSTSLSAGIRWFLVMQSVAQVTERYGREAKPIILENCSIKVLVKTTDAEETGRLFSTLAGRYTCRGESSSTSGDRLSPIKRNASKSQSLMGRDWFSPADICTWHADYGALVHKGGVAGGCLLIPLPDVSKTPTTAYFGLGDKKHNAELSRRALYGAGPKIRRPSRNLWYLGIDRLEGYKTKELKQNAILKAEGDKLTEIHRNKKTADEKNREHEILAKLVKPDGTEITGEFGYNYADELRQGNGLGGRFRGWDFVPGDTVYEIDKKIKERQERIDGLKPKKSKRATAPK
mgnify:FL=1